MTRRIPPPHVAGLLAAALVLTACGPVAVQVTQNGAADQPVTLKATSYHVQGRSGGDQLNRLIEVVASTAQGSITIAPGPEPDSGAADTSADTIAMVREGKVDLAVVSARTFDTLGVTSLQALQAPYLVRSNAQADAVLADPLADRMLDGVGHLGLVGLGLAFDFMAYPGGFGAPVLDVPDYEGHAFQVRPSRANDLLVQALGATSNYSNGQEMEQSVASGELRGSWGYFDTSGGVSKGEVFTVNAPAFLRANVIVANAKVFTGLSASQQQALRGAAAVTRDWMAARHTDLAKDAAAYCASGLGGIAHATRQEQDGVQSAAATVVRAMENDSFNRAAIARIRELGANVPVVLAPKACSAVDSAMPLPTLPAVGDQGVINGVWRLEVDPQPLRAAGWAEDDIANNAGTWTWTFNNGAYQYVEPHGRKCSGTYTISGHDLLIVNFQPIGCDLVLPLVFSRSGDRLTLTPDPDQRSGVPLTGASEGQMTPDPEGTHVPFFRNPLVRVGDAP
jgi:TRAP-type C4-dicarboxylate transport system substrate-binding protein